MLEELEKVKGEFTESQNPKDKSENKQKERVDAAWIIYNGMEG